MALSKKNVSGEKVPSLEVEVKNVELPNSADSSGINDLLKVIAEQNAQNNKAFQLIAESLSSSSDKTDILAAVEGIVRGNKERETGQFSFDEIYQESEIDIDDVLEKENWVVFISHMYFNTISSDKRHGIQIKAPRGLINFEFDSTNVRHSGKSVEIHQLCTYTCRSKVELEWLRKHSLYNITFFENMKSATTYDSKKAMILAKFVTVLRSDTSGALLFKLKENGLPQLTDREEMISTLANFYADQEMRRVQSSMSLQLSEYEKELESISNK